AGGRGLLVIFEGFNNAMLGKTDAVIEFADNIASTGEKMGEQFHINYIELADIEFGYCTEFFVINLHKKTTLADIDRFRENLMNIGDCVLVIGDLSLIKVHVHTNEPGKALSYALKLGEIDKIKIENMFEQNRVLIAAQPEDLKPQGMVAVCAGEGLANIFRDLQVDGCIEGGQSMNPSAEDIAKACDQVRAKDVFVLPNNSNIILAAEQAKHLSKRNIIVVPTKSVPEGLSAALAFNPEDSVSINTNQMTESTRQVKSGSVTCAVRTTEMDGLQISEGDIIALGGKKIVSNGADINAVTTRLVDTMVDENATTITLYYGDQITLEAAEELSKELSKKYKQCDVDVQCGGQPVYHYLVSVE
ncbi:MAG: DAK2 domain-containing protein, partial [Firmicutes bacterium]|nr:DAK2 domain-containing protein [Bacillota bacterium]